MKNQHCIRQAWLLLGLLVTLSSCKKGLINPNLPQIGADSAQTVNSGNNNQPLITRYEYAPNLYTLFSYNSAGQITSITDINDIAQANYTITYKTGGKVDQVNLAGGFWKFTYNNNLLQQADAYINGNPAPQGYYKFVYDGQKIIQVLLFSNYGGSVMQPRSKAEIQYDANGDITRSDTYLWDITTSQYNLAEYQFYESDTHPNPVYWFRDIFMVLYRVVGQHNFTKAESFYPDGSIDQNNTYEFTYDTNGYPTSALRKNLAAGTNGFVTLKFVYQ